MARPSLLDLDLEGVSAHLSDLPGYRPMQIWQAVFRDLADSYDAITTLPRALRTRLAEELPFPILESIEEAHSQDRSTHKTLFRLADGETVESVTMIYPHRATACVSSQVGCSVGCPFCATGLSGFVRDLTTSEIVAQVLHTSRQVRHSGRRLSNIVYMGMGEPFLNYHATLNSIRILNDPRGFALGARAFTVSTAGVVPGIDRFADEPLQANLAISLHTAHDRVRDRLVPINRRYPIASLLAATRRYTDTTHRRVTFEIALIEDVNDAAEDAASIARLLRGLLCHVNLIPHNPASGFTCQPSPAGRVRAFADALAQAGIPVTIRKSMGIDIRAGCGQLRARGRSVEGGRQRSEGAGSSR